MSNLTISSRLDGLDVLRAAAALSVFAGHFYVLTESHYDLLFLPLVLRSFFVHGPIGVDLFYVLSGFFIGSAVMKSSFEPIGYCTRRLRRIVPAYYFSILILIVLVAPYFIISADGLKHTLLHLLFVHNITPFAHGSINGAYWTLGVEMQFYIMLLVFSGFVRARGRKFIVFIVSLFVVSLIWRIVGFEFFKSTNRFYFSTQLPGSLDRFAVGLIIARLVGAGFPFWDKHITIKKIIWFAAALSPLIIAYGLAVMDHASWWNSLLGFVSIGLFLSIMFGLLVVGVITTFNNEFARNICRVCGLAYLGKISYSFYLYHIPVILSLKPFLPIYVSDFFSQLSLTFLCVLAISSASYHLVEARWHVVK